MDGVGGLAHPALLVPDGDHSCISRAFWLFHLIPSCFLEKSFVAPYRVIAITRCRLLARTHRREVANMPEHGTGGSLMQWDILRDYDLAVRVLARSRVSFLAFSRSGDVASSRFLQGSADASLKIASCKNFRFP